MRGITRSRRMAVVGVLLGIALVGGCSSSAKSSSPSTASTASTTSSAGSTSSSAPASNESATCQAAKKFKDSLSALAEPSTYTGGKSSIQAALDSVKSSLDGLQSTLKSGDKPKVDALRSSISDLQDGINNASGISGFSAVASAIKNVGESGQAVLEAAQAGCPSA